VTIGMGAFLPSDLQVEVMASGVSGISVFPDLTRLDLFRQLWLHFRSDIDHCDRLRDIPQDFSVVLFCQHSLCLAYRA
jgi:hypothetical protein